MKKLQKIRSSILFILCFVATGISASAQDSATAVPTVRLRYFVNNNSIQYLLLESGMKTGKKFQPLPRQIVKLFLDSNNAENLVSKSTTDENGKAKVIIPPAFKDKWNSSPKHHFTAILEDTSLADEITTSIEITKSKIVLDTSTNDGVRSINVKVMFFEKDGWVPAKDVEMKIGVNRSGSILSAGDEETYTTDSTGTASVEFKRDSLPGDLHGDLILAAKVEDNDLYGNLLVEKTVPWGVLKKTDSAFFDQRTLWTTRFRTPAWLLIIAYSIFISVWATLIYLVFQIVKIKKLSREQA